MEQKHASSASRKNRTSLGGSVIRWILLALLIHGGYDLLSYVVSMYYSRVSSQQLVDDSAYTVLQTQSTVQGILIVWVWVGIIWCIVGLFRSIRRHFEID